MPRTLGLRDLGVVEAEEWTAVTWQLLRAQRPILATARLTGGVVALGRYQRAASVLTDAGQRATIVRRPTGGRALALGDGLLAAAVAVPHRSWLVDTDPAALPASKFINRSVRGVLAGLGALGVGAYYFGRDFITVDSAQAAYVSFEISDSSALLECVFAVEAHWSLPPNLDGLPPRAPIRGVPGPGVIHRLDGVTSAGLLDALARGYCDRFGLDGVPDESDLPSAVPTELPSRASWSRLREVPIGFVEAGVDLRDGVIESASLCGDFLADSGGIASAERALSGCRPDMADIAPRLNGVYTRQDHTVLGVTDLTVFGEALLEACAA